MPDDQVALLSAHNSSPLADDYVKQELTLLSGANDADMDVDNEMPHEVLTAPVMTRGALLASGMECSAQYGVLGKVLSIQYVRKSSRQVCANDLGKS